MKELFELRDEAYAEFQAKLMPTVARERIIGVRTPLLRRFAADFGKRPEAQDFLNTLPHKYYEEDNLHAFIIEKIKDFDSCIEALDKFLPYVDNWATCDSMSPKVLKKQPEKLMLKIKEWLTSDRTYTVRFAMGLLMSFYLDENFEEYQLSMVADYRSEEYYIRMMQAWYFATALAKQYDAALPYIREQRMEKWTHNKAIQKAVESYRVSDERKAYLKTLKIK